MQGTGKKMTRVVIVGGGFAGINAAKTLAQNESVSVTLIDKHNYHTFNPLLYQVASAELEVESISSSLRGIFRKFSNVSCVLANVTGIDHQGKIVTTDEGNFEYDYLVLASGSVTAFFGTKGAEEKALTLKTLLDATTLRNHLFSCFERASVLLRSGKLEKESSLLKIAIVGAGPTGVEYAGSLAELIQSPLTKDFPELANFTKSVSLLDAQDNVLSGFPEKLQNYTQNKLEKMGVKVLTGVKVAEVDEEGVLLGDGTRIPACTVVWAAGVRGSSPEEKDFEIGRDGRIVVSPSLQTKLSPHIFVAGDLARIDGDAIPMVAPAALQQGQHVGESILRCIEGKEPEPFKYNNKGAMAIIGRNSAVTSIGKFTMTGFFAWNLWLIIHIAYLIGFRTRLIVFINWTWDYIFKERAVRLLLSRTTLPKDLK